MYVDIFRAARRAATSSSKKKKKTTAQNLPGGFHERDDVFCLITTKVAVSQENQKILHRGCKGKVVGPAPPDDKCSGRIMCAWEGGKFYTSSSITTISKTKPRERSSNLPFCWKGSAVELNCEDEKDNVKNER